MNVLAKGKDYRKDYFKKLKAAEFDVIFGGGFFGVFFAYFSVFLLLFILFCFQSKQMICIVITRLIIATIAIIIKRFVFYCRLHHSQGL